MYIKLDCISRQRMNELMGYCKKYITWKSYLNEDVSTGGIKLDGLPHGYTISNPTQNTALRRVEYGNNVKRFENICKDVSAEHWDKLLRCVTEDDTGYYDLFENDGIMTRKGFNQLIKKFFINLDSVIP